MRNGEISKLQVVYSWLGNLTPRELPVTENKQLDVLEVALLSQRGLTLLGRQNVFQLCSHIDHVLAEQLRRSQFAALPAI